MTRRARTGRALLFDPSDLTRAFQVARIAVAAAIMAAAFLLVFLWQWAAGSIVVLAAFAVAVDAVVRHRRGASTSLVALLVADITAVGAGMLLSGLPDLLVVAPFGYMLTAAVLVLSRRQGLGVAGYLSLWAAGILLFDVPMIGGSLDLGQQRLVVGLGVFIYLGATYVLTSTAAAAVRERNALDERLHASRTQLRTVVGGAPVVLFAVDRNGVFTLSEGAGLAALGLEPGEVVGRGVRDVYAGAPQVAELVETALDGGSEHHALIDLGDVYFDVRLSPQVDGLGNVVGTIGIATDVSEQVQARRELEERVAMQQLISRISAELIALRSEDASDGIVRALGLVADSVWCDQAYLVAPADGHAASATYTWLRDRAAPAPFPGGAPQQLPWFESRLQSSSFISLQRIDDLPRHAAEERSLWRTMGLGSVAAIPITTRLVTGAYIVFATVGRERAWSEDDAIVFRVVGEMLANVIAHKRSRARLEQLIRSKDQFVASISHELRTPLSSVLGLSEELRDRFDDFDRAEVGSFHEILAEQAGELSAIVEDLLVVARADIDQVTIASVDVDVSTEILDALAALRLPEQSRIAIAPARIRAWCDPGRLRQIIRNLATNAVRYGGPHIEVVVSRTEESAQIEIRDDGSGVPDGQEARIFEPYEHGDVADNQPGSIGLGLTVARKLARLMGGDLVYEREGEWSVFRVSLPLSTPISDVWKVAG